MRRIGIFAGTFDPVHRGHVAFAVEARRVCGLDEVVFLPEHRPRSKTGVTAIEHRLALLELAVGRAAGLRVERLESAQFSVAATLPELRSRFPGAQFTLLVGSDVVASLQRWDDIGRLLKEMRLAVGIRRGAAPELVADAMRSLERRCGYAADYTCISAPDNGEASSRIRDHPAGVSRLQPGVLGYIRQHNLYQSGAKPRIVA